MGFDVGSALNAVANTGVTLKSARDYQQEQTTFASQQATNAANLQGQNIANDRNQAMNDDAARARANILDNQAAAKDYYADPGAANASMNQPPPPAAAPAPTPPPQPMPASALPSSSGTLSADAATPPDPSAGAPDQSAAPTQDQGAAQPSISDGSGATQQTPAPILQQQQAGLTPPPGSATPPQQVMPPNKAQGTGKAGLYDYMAQRAEKRGDFVGAQNFRAEKQQQIDEGMKEVALIAKSTPADTTRMMQEFNEHGPTKWKSLVYNGNGMYSGTIVGANGQDIPFTNQNIVQQAMDKGLIPYPPMMPFKADENVFARDTSGGGVHQIQAAQANDVKMNRVGDWIEYDKSKSGSAVFHSADGSTTRLTPAAATDMKGITSIATKESAKRATALADPMMTDKSTLPPQIDTPQVISTAHSIYLNNPDKRASGLDDGLATKIAIGINDHDPNARLGTAMLGGKQYDVVTWGSGKKAVTYGLRPSAQQPAQVGPQTRPPAAPSAPQPAPASTAAPAPSPPPAQRPVPARVISAQADAASIAQMNAMGGAQADKSRRASLISKTQADTQATFASKFPTMTSKEAQMYFADKMDYLTNAQKLAYRNGIFAKQMRERGMPNVASSRI